MRYGKDQKQATRQRIVEAAGRRFKQDGIDGAGVAVVMSDAGLTNGAFYGHFSSKETPRAPPDLRAWASKLWRWAPSCAATKQVFTEELMGVIDDIAVRLDPTDVEAARTDALTLFGLMVGTLQLARALTDRNLSDQLLARGAETALKLLDNRA